jgi:tRNA uridine 5-carboxymethylaminomethyl modification enzyme
VDIARLTLIWPELGQFAPEIIEQLEIDAHYAGYLDRQDADIIAFRRDESLLIPDGFDYAAVAGSRRNAGSSSPPSGRGPSDRRPASTV